MPPFFSLPLCGGLPGQPLLLDTRILIEEADIFLAIAEAGN